MVNFRCNMLDEHDKVMFPADIVAESLDAAVRHAFRIREESNHGTSPSRRVYAFEVWSDSGPELPEFVAGAGGRAASLTGRAFGCLLAACEGVDEQSYQQDDCAACQHTLPPCFQAAPRVVEYQAVSHRQSSRSGTLGPIGKSGP